MSIQGLISLNFVFALSLKAKLAKYSIFI